MGILTGLVIGILGSIAICGIACFGAMCARIIKEAQDEKTAKKKEK